MAIGRPREFDREVALEAAMLAFWRKGFVATSMTDICDAMSVRSPSVYAAFGNKEALYIEAVQHYANTIGASIWEHLATGPDVRASVGSFLLTAAERLPEAGVLPAGCMVALATVDAECPAAIVDTIKTIRSQCLEILRSRLNEAVTTGELPASTDIPRWSRFYMAVYLGMAIQARDGATATELKGVVEAALTAWPLAETC